MSEEELAIIPLSLKPMEAEPIDELPRGGELALRAQI